MKTATQDLFTEHIAIMHALKIMEEISLRLQRHGKANYADVIDLTDFLKTFADKCHHGKEEDFLLPAIKRAGLMKDDGPINAILSEHNQGRDYIREMHDSVIGIQVNEKKFIESSLAYVALLREHIRKENTLLFPLVDAGLSASEQEELFRQFQEFEEKVIGNGRHEELHTLLERLKQKYLTETESVN